MKRVAVLVMDLLSILVANQSQTEDSIKINIPPQLGLKFIPIKVVDYE